MPSSQLKKLKASLREAGALGPQKSKKQKKQLSKNGPIQERRSANLAGIREKSNPFNIRAPGRASKHAVISRQAIEGRVSKKTTVRPGLAKALGEENVGVCYDREIID